MKFTLISDIHLEWKNIKTLETLPVQKDTCCIIAGDMCGASDITAVLNVFCEKYDSVIYIPGNHEFYGRTIADVHNLIASIKCTNLYTINSDGVMDVIVHGKRIVGCTLWSPMTNEYACQSAISDFKYIHNENGDDYISVAEIKRLHAYQTEWLKETLTSQVDIVVTHHVPLNSLVREEHQNSTLQGAYIANVDTTILSDYSVQFPTIWCFGHTHDSVNIDHPSGIKFMCNPIGYKDVPLSLM